jgi:AAA ATPase domain
MTVIPDPGTRRERGSPVRPLLEREAELAALSAVVEAARSGDGRLVVVEGPAGIGKTRLLAEARSLATEFEVLSARAGELESDFAFGIVRQLFEGALVGASGGVRDELLSGAAALAGPLFALVPGEAEQGGGETSFAMLHGLYWLAANFALRRPTLLIVDDLHWADEPSLRWLGYLARRLEGLPMVIVTATLARQEARRDHVPQSTRATRCHAPHQGADQTQHDEPLAGSADPRPQPNPQGLGQLPSPRREQPLLRLPQPLPVVAGDPLAAQEVPAADLETDQATVLGAPLDQPGRHEARVARRGTRDPIPLSRPQHPLTMGDGPRHRPSHHSAGNRHCITNATIGHRVLWRAGCVGMRMSGSEGGSGKRTGGNADTAPWVDPTS